MLLFLFSFFLKILVSCVDIDDVGLGAGAGRLPWIIVWGHVVVLEEEAARQQSGHFPGALLMDCCCVLSYKKTMCVSIIIRRESLWISCNFTTCFSKQGGWHTSPQPDVHMEAVSWFRSLQKGHMGPDPICVCESSVSTYPFISKMSTDLLQM